MVKDAMEFVYTYHTPRHAHACMSHLLQFLSLPLGQLQAEEVRKVVERFSRTMRTIQP